MIQALKTVRSVSTPVVLITTTDQAACQTAIAAAFSKVPVVSWNSLQGFTPANTLGKQLLAEVLPTDALPGTTPGLNPAEAFTYLLDFPEKTITILHNAHKEWGEKVILQGIAVARDVNKVKQNMLILLAPAATLPSEVVQDVVVIDDPLPDEARLGAILTEQVGLAKQTFKALPDPGPDTAAIVSGLQGLTEYAAESTIALSIAEAKKVCPVIVMRRKRDIIGQVKGLKWDNWSLPLSSLGGLGVVTKFAERVFAGARPPRLVMRVDEIEKQLAGFGGDNTGVSQDLVGVMLRGMEDEGWSGIITVGPPGAGKTAFARSIGATYNVPTIELDFGAVKESLVGNSEANIRADMKVIKAIGGRDVLWVATCNKLDALPPELRRRFKYGVWYFDLPTSEEQEAIWGVNLKSFGLPADAPRPDYTNWTGAEIRNACELAANLSVTPADVAQYILPVAMADPSMIKRLRESANGKWLSASTPGPYRLPEKGAGRSYATEQE